MFLRASKVEAEAAGEATEGMANSVSELHSKLLKLTNGRVDILTDSGQYKSTYEILKDISEVWDDIVKNQGTDSAAILELIGGKRNANTVAAILENFDIAEDALKESLGSAGSAMEENQKVIESVQGHINQLKAAFEELSLALIDSGLIKGVVDFANGLLEAITAVMQFIDKVKVVKELLIALMVTLSITTVANLFTAGIKWMVSSIKSVIQIIPSAIAAWKAYATGTTNAAGAVVTASSAIQATIPVIGLLLSAITAVVGAIALCGPGANDAAEEFNALKEEFQGLLESANSVASEFRNMKQSAEDIIPRFAELAEGVNKLGENAGLTDEEYAEFLSLNNKIAEMFPELNLGMDNNGNAMLALSYTADTLAESLWKVVEAQRAAANAKIAESMPDALKKTVEIVSGYKGDIAEIASDYDFLIATMQDGENDNRDFALKKEWPSGNWVEPEEMKQYLKLLDKYGIGYEVKHIGNSGLYRDVIIKDIDAAYALLEELKERQTNNLEAYISGTWDDFAYVANAWMQTDTLYGEFDAEVQNIAKRMFAGIDFENLGLTTDTEIESYIRKNIINPLYNAGPQVRAAIEQIDDWQQQLKSGEITATQFGNHVKAAFDGLKNSMPDQEFKQFQKLFVAGFNAFGVTGSDFDAVVSSLIQELSNLKISFSELTVDFEQFVETLSKTYSLDAGFSKLSSIFSDVKDGGLFDWSSILGNEDFNNAFGGLGDAYDDFIKTVANAPDDIDACQAAFDNLATAYIWNSDALEGVTDETRNATVAMLEQMGVANAATLVDEHLALNKETARLQSELQADATHKEVLALYDEETATRITAQAIFELAIAKIQTNENAIVTSSEIDQLEGLAKSANATEASLLRVAQAKALMAKAEKLDSMAANWKLGVGFDNYLSDVKEQAEAARKEAQELLSKPLEYNEIDFSKYKVQYNGGSATNSNKSSGSGSNKEETWFEKQLSMHQHLVAMNQETQEEYLTWLNSAYKKAYDEGIIDLNDYYKYTEEVYHGLQDLFRDYLSDVEHEISMRENYDGEARKIIELYEGLIKKVEKEIADTRARGLTDEDDYIQELQKKWQDYTDSIEDLRDEITESAKDALDELIDYRVDMLKQEIEDEKDALDKRLDNLKEFYDKQKEMLQDQRDEENYLKDQSEKRKTVTDLQAELAMLANDDSAWAQKRKLELQEEITTAQEDLDEFEKDHALDLALDALDKAYNDQEAQLQAEMDALEERLNDPEALYNKALEDIRKNSENQLYYQMLMYNRQYGDGNDETVKDLWEAAFGALSDYEKLFGELYKGVGLENEIGVEDKGGWDNEKISGTNPDNQQPITNPSGSTTTETPKSYPYGKASESSGNISKGSTGAKVKAIQYALNELGFGNSGTADCDGVFGNGTQSAVMAFQSAMGISVDGIVGKDTRAKFKAQGYAVGTSSATPGIHAVDELGTEYIFESPSDGTRYRMFHGGEKVLTADATDFLYQFANSGGSILTKMISDLFRLSSFGNISKPVQAIEVNSGDIIVQGNASERTVSEIRRAQRENLEFVLKSLNSLNK